MMTKKESHNWKRNSVFYWIVAAAATLSAAAACTTDQQPAEGALGAGVPVMLNVDMAVAADPAGATRAAQSVYTAKTFQQGDAVYCYFHDQLVFTIPHAIYTCAAPSADKNACTPDQQCYMKSATEKPMYAYYPSQVTESTTSFSVQQDQSDDKNYRISDLMYGTGTVATNGRCVNDAVNGSSADALTLQHQMTRIQITATDKSGAGITRISVISGHRTVALTRADGALSLGALSDPITPQSPVTVWTGSATAQNAAVQCAVLLPPQSFAAGTNLLMVTTSKGDIVYSVAAKSLVSGSTYNLTFDVTHVNVSGANIAAWGDGGALANTENDDLLYRVNGVDFRMKFVEGGSYNTLRGIDVTGTLSDYYLAETETTQALWSALSMAAPNQGGIKTTGTTMPVGGTGYNQITGGMVYNKSVADGFLVKLNTATATQRPMGWGFDLPSEAQWEYAARGGKYTHNFTWPGTNDASEVTNYAWVNQDAYKAVATKLPNELGLYDMGGNVWEIVKDHGSGSTSPAVPAGNLGPDYVSLGAAPYDNKNGDTERGGGNAQSSVNYYTVYHTSNGITNNVGFRVALVPAIGWILTDRGHIFPTKALATAAGETPVAMVAYVGSGNAPTKGVPDKSYSSEYNHGLAIALTDCDTDGKTTSTLIGSGSNTSATTLNGYVKKYKVAQPANTSGWIVPSVYQWQRMLVACGSSTSYIATPPSSDYEFNRGKIIDYLTAAGGTTLLTTTEARYWTSTEDGSAASASGKCAEWRTSQSDGRFGNVQNCYLRPIVAF